jgi:pyrroloquinoline quinone (PQQ) biosynthesis protein C
MTALLDRIKKAEAAKAAGKAANLAAELAALSDQDLLDEIARADEAAGVSAERIEQHRRFWTAAFRGDIGARRALEKHRPLLDQMYSPNMSPTQMRAWLAEFDMMQSTPVSVDELSNYA